MYTVINFKENLTVYKNLITFYSTPIDKKLIVCYNKNVPERGTIKLFLISLFSDFATRPLNGRMGALAQ